MRKHIKLSILSFSVMVTIGLILNIRGTLIPSIKFDLGISYGKIGLMLMITSLGFMFATFFGGRASSKYGLKKVVYLGLILMGISVSSMTLVTSTISLIMLMALLGIGIGFAEIGINTLGSKIFTNKSGMMMNLLHFFFGLGSAVGPRLAGWMLTKEIKWNYIYFYSLSLITAVFIFLIFTHFPEEIEKNNDQPISYIKVINNKKIWLFTLVLGLSITAESGIANWLVNYLQIEHSFSPASSSFYLSLFFILFTLGRLFGGYLTEFLGYMKSIVYFSIMILVNFILGILLKENGAIFFSITGLFISIMFPTIIAIVIREFKKNTGTYMGFVITGASATTMIINWIIGKTTEIFSVYIGFASIIIYIIALLFFLFFLNRTISSDNFSTQNTY